VTPTTAPLAKTPAAEPKEGGARWGLIALVVAIQARMLAFAILVVAALGA